MKNKIISKLKEKPKTKLAWWTMGLGLSIIFAGRILSIIVTMLFRSINPVEMGEAGGVFGFNPVMVSFALAISTLIVGFIAFKKGERSWVLWVGLIPAILFCAFLIPMIIGEALFPH
jgi:MFS family permease